MASTRTVAKPTEPAPAIPEVNAFSIVAPVDIVDAKQSAATYSGAKA